MFKHFKAEDFSRHMARIRSRDTQPEMIVRRLTHRLGYRYRLHDRRLPGSPDLVFPARRKVVLVHGCLWHGHEGCRLNRRIAAHPEYWQPKLAANKRRDAANLENLAAQRWEALVIWECETRDLEGLRHRLVWFLGPRGSRK